MASHPILDLPNEILVRIFEHVVGLEWSPSRARSYVAPGLILKPAMLVCHKWKDVALPLLYRDLIFSQSAALNDAAAACLLASERGNNFAQHIRSLSFLEDLEGFQEINSLFLLLACPSRLRSLNVHNPPSSLFVVIGRTTISETLSHLKVVCPLDSAPLRQLSPFQNLRELNLILHASLIPARQSPLSLQLPLLRHLSWQDTSPNSTEENLMSCRFPALRGLLVGMVHFERVHNPKFNDRTTRFFEMHDQLKQVEISLGGSLSVALVPLVTARHLMLNCYSSTPTTVAELPACVHVLSLRFYMPKAARLFDMLDALSSTTTGLREVHVNSEAAGVRFSWTAGEKSDEDAQFIGKMLVHAHRPGARGIRLFDQERRCALVTEAQPSILDSQD